MSRIKQFLAAAVWIIPAAALLVASCAGEGREADIDPDEIVGQVELPPLDNVSGQKLRQQFENMDMEEQVADRGPIPEKVSTSLPDFTKYEDVETKKKEFFSFLRPIIRKENQEVLRERAFILLKWQKFKNQEEPGEKEIKRLGELAEKYRVKSDYGQGADFFRELLIHVDKIPVDLALIQAAKESAWGTSYFAREGNNLFGQWCFTDSCGLTPRKRPEGATYEVEVFDDAAESVRSYIRNLNSHPAYRDLRLQRYKLRLAGGEPDGHFMAGGLEKYSEIGMQYVRTVRQMIRGNQRFMGIQDLASDT